MDILVLGGTGSCGRYFVAHALNEGFKVRVFTRKPETVTVERFNWAENANLDIYTGDLKDLKALINASKGVNAVVSMAGPSEGAKTSIMPEAIRNTVTAMRKNGVKRLIVQTGGFVKLKGETVTFLDRAAREAFMYATDKAATLKGNDDVATFLQEECDDIDWTITRPGHLSEDEVRGAIEPENNFGPGVGSTVSKIDLTRWYLELLHEANSIHKAPVPNYAAVDFGFARERIEGKKRIAVITGANSGLGFETARVLLLKGMKVVCACRNEQRGLEAVAQLRELTKSRLDAQAEDVSLMKLDTSSLKSVRDFVIEYQSLGLPIHVLLCNAGIMMGPPRRSVDGFDLQMATNYLGHFLLCNELTPLLKQSAPARVIHVSSIAGRNGTIDFDNFNPPVEGYDSLRMYQMTKHMQVVFSRELNARLKGTGVTSNSLEPGIVATNLSKGVSDSLSMQKKLEKGVSVEEGAKTHVFLAASLKVSGRGGGNYVNNRDISSGSSNFQHVLSGHSLRKIEATHLWGVSEKMVELEP